MTNSFLGNILKSPKFLFYSQLLGSCVAGGTFVFFITSNQMQYYKDQNNDLQAKYQLSAQIDQKKCEEEEALVKLKIENSMLIQYKKFGKDSKESQLFLETINLLNEKNSK